MLNTFNPNGHNKSISTLFWAFEKFANFNFNGFV